MPVLEMEIDTYMESNILFVVVANDGETWGNNLKIDIFRWQKDIPTGFSHDRLG